MIEEVKFEQNPFPQPGYRILVLDDDENRLEAFQRRLIGNVVTCARTAPEAIKELSDGDKFDTVYLDHDLGGLVMQDSGPGTGYEVAAWIRDNPSRAPENVVIHSFNPVGAKRMQDLIPGSILSPGCWMAV